MSTRLLELLPTSLFGDKAILLDLEGREEISQPFEFFLTIASPNATIKPEDVIGQALAVQINRGDEDPRFMHGYISHFWAGDFSETKDKKSAPSRHYRVRIVPWISFMQYASRSFVYLPEKKEKSISDVLDEVIKRVKSYGHVEAWINSNSAKILKSRKVEHCVQYRETDFNFLTRTLERYGVYYYFTHEKDKHTLVLSDVPNYPDCAESKVDFPVSSTAQLGDEGVILSWEHAYEFVPGKFEQKDYDFKQPSTDLKTKTSKHDRITLVNNKNYEMYDFPGSYMQKEDGENEIVRRLEQEEVRFNRVQGSSSCKSFLPGHCFKIGKHHSCEDEKDKSYLISSIRHSASQPGEFTDVGSIAAYRNYFECVPKDAQYRPRGSGSQPHLASVQTAVVVGPKGEEIYTDEFGRVKVQFHWDREGKKDENTSCWIRVSQIHAGKGFGGIDIPRVGEEVIVSFIEGNLDNPVITGRLYHKESMPPFTLPDKKTVSGIKTKTYKGTGYNEMSMDDTPGKELINIHAQYNMTTTVEHDDKQTVHNNREITVDGTHTETIDKDTKITIKTGTLEHKVNTGTALYYVKAAVTENFDDTQSTNVKKKITIKSTEDEIYVEAAKKITLHTGDSMIELTKEGVITLKAKTINIVGDVNVSVSGPKIEVLGSKETKMGVSNQNFTADLTKAAIAGAAINSSAVGMHEITGALVKIN